MDIALDSNYNPIITNGNFTVADTTAQEIHFICQYPKGTFRGSPLVGVGVMNFANSPQNSDALEKEVTKQLQNDGMRNIFVVVDNSNPNSPILTANANRN